MSVIARMLKQTCVYWPPDGVDEFGVPQFLTPIQLKCRWEGAIVEHGQREAEIQQVFTDVYLSNLVGTVVESGGEPQIGGYLLYGFLSSSTPPNPIGLLLAYRIEEIGKFPNFKCTQFLRKANLRWALRGGL